MPTTNIQQGSAEWEEWRKRATEPVIGKRSALYFFVSKILELGDVIPMTPLAHYPMCLFAERATGIPEIDSCARQLILAPRGIGKSGIITNGRTTQQLCRGCLDSDYRNYAIGIANETQPMASNFLNMIKENFEQKQLVRALFPEIIPQNFNETTWTQEKIVLDRTKSRPSAPSVLAAGANSTVTGVHMDEWLCDDLISEDLAENTLRGNTTEIEKMQRFIVRLPPLLNAPMRDPISFVGTRWFANDTYEFIEKYFGNVPDDVNLDDAPKQEFNWILKLPSDVERGGAEKISINLYKRGDLAVYKRPALEDGRSIFPERYTKEELYEMSQKPGSSQFFNAMYMLEPTSGEDTVFDEEWLMPYAWSGQAHPEYNRQTAITYYTQQGEPRQTAIRDLTCFISVDPAVSDKQSAARTAIPVVGTDGQHLFLLEDFAERGMGAFDIAEQVISFAQVYDPQKIYVETIGQQKLLMDPIHDAGHRRGLQLNIEEISRHSQLNKDARIWGMERWFKRRLFYVHKSHQDFRREYSAFPRGGAMRDILDALSFQMDGWSQAMRLGQSRPNVDAGDIQEKHRQAAQRAAEQLA